MRHLVGFVVGLILAPAILLGMGWALPRLQTIAGYNGTFLSFSGLTTVAALSTLALIVSVALAAPRLTPLVPGIAGLLLVGASAVHIVRTDLIDTLPLPAPVPGLEGATTLLSLGVYVPVGAALLIPLLLPSRWQSYRPRGAHAAHEEDDYLDDFYDDEDEDDDGEEPAPSHTQRAVM
ncbi:hypothetical protein [Salinactinospora qingdaonensis]|uniref:Tryptophan-associated transmembrane protein (Trp_oprn_chp) n=1 Tax=Salinactinospora qingdaonensis TaxID=702744 RepID=A0ABP7GHL0_9ACTN